MGTRKRPRGRRPVQDITAPQQRTLKEIRRFADEHGLPPTMQELADVLGISHASAHEQVSQLVRKGCLKREPKKARGLVIARDFAIAEDTDAEALDRVAVPIVDRVAAGPPLLAEENIVGAVQVELKTVGSSACFALEVTGDSMQDAGIGDGDLVIVRRQPLAERGDIVVALLDDEATVKRLFIRDQQIELRPENPKHRPIPVGPDGGLSILGKVVAVQRRLSGQVSWR